MVLEDDRILESSQMIASESEDTLEESPQANVHLFVTGLYGLIHPAGDFNPETWCDGDIPGINVSWYELGLA